MRPPLQPLRSFRISRGRTWIVEEIDCQSSTRSKSAPGCNACAPEISTLLWKSRPGLITGAADDDPSGISTYSVTGAAFGYSCLWTALFSFPLMARSSADVAARLGMVSGQGLAGCIRYRYPRWVLWGACSLLIVANVINIGADLAGMAKTTEMVTGIDSLYLTPMYAIFISSLILWTSYKTIAQIFKWLTLVLFAYVAAAVLAHPHRPDVIRSTLIPHLEWNRTFIATLVGIFGTTISPYLFFWQASQEVEEERERKMHD